MKITEIAVEKLFGVFDHVIPLNQSGQITIVIGENGLGKTVILEAVNALFDGKYGFFSGLDFTKFTFKFDNGDSWYLTKKESSESCSLFVSRANKDSKKIKEHKISNITSNGRKVVRSAARRSRALRERELELEYRWLMGKDSGYIDIDDFDDFERMYHYRQMRKMAHIHWADEEEVNPPKWFTDGIENIDVRLIETQRVMTVKESGSDSYVNTVQRCSTELNKMISLAAKESADATSILDSTYPNRLIKKLKQGTNDTFEDLNSALIKLDQRRKVLSSIGLVIDSEDSDILQIKENQKDLVGLLKLYIDDSHEKLDPFDSLAKKIILLKSIVNKRFKHKTLEIRQGKGLVFKSTVIKGKSGDYVDIPSSKLSSGEQNELILFYKLIFEAKENDLYLIDEPELSLHISWQNKFINDLKDVTKMNKVTIVIATHSPDIIDNNWDLKVELEGVE
ncbi:AAA family ATPase [Vibrio harveyi]|nr:AAA family ATPase [Vibrio harveyi]